ncbi:unnamed protein product [Caretta caretta]
MDHDSHFFYAMEKRRGAKKHVTCLLVEDGTPLTDLEEMCGRARAFYANLFSPDPTDADAHARRVLYTDMECLVRLNWTLTEPVSIGRGVWHGCSLLGQLYTLAIEPFLCLLHRRLTGLALWELELRLVLSAYADDMLLVVQDPHDLVRVEACQAVYSAASSARVNWVKSSGLVVGDGWQASSLPPALQAIRWSVGPLLYLGVYLSATHPSPLENWQDLEARVGN